MIDMSLVGEETIYKIVVKEEEHSLKTFRGYIISSNDKYITLKFINDDIKVFINHQYIISISEVQK